MYMLVISLIVAALAVARVTRFLIEDRLSVKWRQWVVKRWGADSLPSYFVHCPWCMGMWMSLLAVPAVLYPYQWVVAIYAVPAISMVTGLLLDRKE
jgi:hypothetical protein